MGEARRKKLAKSCGLSGHAPNIIIVDEFYNAKYKSSTLSKIKDRISYIVLKIAKKWGFVR